MSNSTIWAAGFNAFHQISTHDGDVWTFEPFAATGSASTDTHDKEILYASWSGTVIREGTRLSSRGFQNFDTECPALREGFSLQSPFGDHNGLIGCLDSEGRVFYLDYYEGEKDASTATLTCPSGREAPPLSHVSVAGNGRVAVTFKQAPNARLTHIAEFRSLADFMKWHADPSNEAHYPAAHHMLPGRPRQLLANAANFILLTEGEVYTWGDPRFRTLARSTAGEEAVPADKPGLVEALGGLKIASVQCGSGVGWMASALSEDGALYLWGTTTPGDEGTIKCLQDVGAGEVCLVDIVTNADAEPADVVSVGIGRNHVAAIADSGKLFVVGDNSNGQLGLGKEQSFIEDWTHVPFPGNLQKVLAAPKATFAFTN